jgi:putative MATE family efflux protein
LSCRAATHGRRRFQDLMHDLTTGSIARHLFKTAGFMLVTMVFQTLYLLVDLYWVGRLGKEAVAAVGIAGNLMFIVFAVTQMLAVGTTTAISHAVGQRDHARALLVFNQSQVLSGLVGALFFAIAMAVRTAYANALSADPVTAALAAEYLLWFIPAMALQFGIVAMGAALRGTGNFKPGMVVQTVTIVINIVLAPVLIFGWFTNRPLGVSGAALATFIAIIVGTIWLTLYFFPRTSYLRFRPEYWKPQIPIWRGMLGIGLPAGTEFGLMAVYLVVIYLVSRPFGAAAQAGFGIGLRIIQALFMPVVALGFAVAPLAGQNFGARKADRVLATFKTSVGLSVGLMLLLAALCHIAPDAMIRFFSTDPQVIAVGEEYLRIVSWNFIASGVVYVAGSMFQAMGNTVPSLIASFMRILIVAIPAVLLSRVPGFELRWIWYLTVVSVILQMALSLALLAREFRLRLNFGHAPGTDRIAEALSAP